MDPVISFINYKGGVGKTTLAVETAAAIAAWGNVKVLICDLDPQANATFYLMDPQEEWAPWSQKRGTLRDVFEAALRDEQIPDLSRYVYTWRKDPSRKTTIDLLPSHIGLMPVDIQLATKYGATSINAVEIVSRALEQVRSTYELIICDCPPNLGLVTRNALFASDSYVIVAMPEYLSTLGIETIISAIGSWSQSINATLSRYGGSFKGPELRGIIFNRVRTLSGGTKSQEAIMADVRRKYGNLVFTSYVSQTDRIAVRAEVNIPIVLSVSSGDDAYRQQIRAVAEEFLKRVL